MKNDAKLPLRAERSKQVAYKIEHGDGLTQSERFIKAAQELGTDDDPERFAERVKKLAKHPLKSHSAETPHLQIQKKS